MNIRLSFRFLTVVLGSFVLCTALPAGAISFGSKDKIKVVNGAPFKDTSKFALGAFRVTFITEDEVVSVAKGSWATGGSSSSASMSGSLEGLDQATMPDVRAEQSDRNETHADALGGRFRHRHGGVEHQPANHRAGQASRGKPSRPFIGAIGAQERLLCNVARRLKPVGDARCTHRR